MSGAKELLRLLTPVIARAGSRKYFCHQHGGKPVETPSTCSYCFQDLDGEDREGHAGWCAIEQLQELARELGLDDNQVKAGTSEWTEQVTTLLKEVGGLQLEEKR